MLRIHSKLVLDNPTEASLYYYCRSLDVDGKGWISLNIYTTSLMFNIKEQSLIKRARRGKVKGFFHLVEVKGNSIYLKLASLSKLKQMTQGVFDCNGAGNIIRKVVGDTLFSQLNSIERCVVHPVRIKPYKTNAWNICPKK